MTENVTTYPSEIRNLVFEGGGVKGVAYCGALHELERAGIVRQVTCVAGASAGAITAALVATGYSAEELANTLIALNFHSFEDGELEGPLRIVEKYGWYRGNAFLEWIRGRVDAKLGTPDATFDELIKARGVDLRVVATNLATRSAQVFCAADTPNVPIAEAVRMSMSIPLFFAAVTFNGAVHVDGGAVWNYPLEVFDGEEPNPATLGFRLENLSAPPPPPVPVHNLAEYGKGLWETIMNAQGGFYTRTLPDVHRSVVIDDLGLTATDFSLSTAQKRALIDNGANATRDFLARRRR